MPDRPSETIALRIQQIRDDPDAGGPNAFWTGSSLRLLLGAHELALAAEACSDPVRLAVASSSQPWTLDGFEALASAFPTEAAQRWLGALPGHGRDRKSAAENHGYAVVRAVGSDLNWVLWESHFRRLAVRAEAQAIFDACPVVSPDGSELRL